MQFMFYPCHFLMLHKHCGILEPSKIKWRAPSFLPTLPSNKKLYLYFWLCYIDNFCVATHEKKGHGVKFYCYSLIIQHPIFDCTKIACASKKNIYSIYTHIHTKISICAYIYVCIIGPQIAIDYIPCSAVKSY